MHSITTPWDELFTYDGNKLDGASHIKIFKRVMYFCCSHGLVPADFARIHRDYLKYYDAVNESKIPDK